jgi:hypothetical protein
MSNHSNVRKSTQAIRKLLCRKVLEAASDVSSDGDDLLEFLAQQMGHRSNIMPEHYVSLVKREAKGEVEVGVCPHGDRDLKALGGAKDVEYIECESCGNILIGHPLPRQDDGTTPPPHPIVPGLTRQYHDLDQITALTAHLNALDEQLAPRRRKSRA